MKKPALIDSSLANIHNLSSQSFRNKSIPSTTAPAQKLAFPAVKPAAHVLAAPDKPLNAPVNAPPIPPITPPIIAP
jgi:hypothetical protein